ncbi:glycosyltransferase [Rhodococcus ruber]|uniref:glycosyltransferase n=1 Tax=Rhodococcus TaxID=1827 RepID=UPI0009E7FD2D|nr:MULTISPECIES: glycosyltransferase [Rhodococcus]RIK06142.1 MAG: glycosyltransferase family 4 protein [Acidobacteriota bacterium]UQB71995.1 glycosyltransferase [Rhodococcus ruber]WKK10023.1 glycosyltransferase [Rhodococcus ruber]WML61830.1 glycosyltransferase [Rhodococcus sp. AH-ZY2]
MSGGVIVHEWIERTGGAENVVEAFAELIPSAPVICLWDDAPGRFGAERIRESALARTPLRRSKALSLPIMPAIWRTRRCSDVEWALVSSHLFAHHVRFANAPNIDRFVYVHTPARYLWVPELDERGSSGLVRAVAPLFRSLDRARAQEGAELAANSRFVAERIRQCWRVDARVIYPPVNVERIQSVADWAGVLGPRDRATLDALPREFVLAASRLVRYKKIEAAIDAGRLTDTPVVVAGDGPDRGRLEAIAETSSVPVYFLGRVNDELLYALYQRCTVYVFTAVEDFGIMPVEAMAAGARVVGNRIGGVSETVVDGVTGALCDPDDATELRDATVVAASCDPETSVEQARRFGTHRFNSNIVEWLGSERIRDRSAHSSNMGGGS